MVGVFLHEAVLLPGGTLLAVGGRNTSEDGVRTIQEWNAESKLWTLRPEQLPIAKIGPLALVPDDWCNPNELH